MSDSKKRGILERLDAGEVVVGDGGFLYCMERRGFVKAGAWTPEATVEHPEAVRQLHSEFLRAGADVMQTFTFYASEDKLENRGHTAVKIGLFRYVEQAEWATEIMKATGKPVAVCLSVSLAGDMNGVLPGECAVRVARAGADIVGVNCCFDPSVCLAVMKEMKEALEKAGLKRHLIVQPIAYHTPELKYDRIGLTALPEFPFALESRLISRWDVQKYAREAYNMGIRYIGACCGFEPYHVRAIAEELAKERGKLPPASEKHGLWGDALRQHTYPWVRARARRSHWENLNPSSGRPLSSAFAKPDGQWDLQPGNKDMLQNTAMTSDKELQELAKRSQEA